MTFLRLLCIAVLFAASIVAADSAIASGKKYHQRINSQRDMIEGSDVLTTQTRAVDPFVRIESNLGIDLKVEVGKTQSVKITFDDNLIDFIRTESDGKTLVIETEESFSTSQNVQVLISVPQLELINSEGSGTIYIANLDSKRFRAIISGSGELVATGKVDLLEIEINGSGDVRTDEVTAREVTVSINGSGSAEVNAVEVLDAEINGSGDVLYVGKPDNVYSSVNGSGKIRKRK